MAKPEQRALARLLYVNGHSDTYRELSEKLGVHERTVSAWAKAEDWDALRDSLNGSSERIVAGLFNELAELNACIKSREEGQRYANAKEADARRKIVATIRDLRSEVTYPDRVQIAMELAEHLQKEHPQDAKKLIKSIDNWLLNYSPTRR